MILRASHDLRTLLRDLAFRVYVPFFINSVLVILISLFNRAWRLREGFIHQTFQPGTQFLVTEPDTKKGSLYFIRHFQLEPYLSYFSDFAYLVEAPCTASIYKEGRFYGSELSCVFVSNYFFNFLNYDILKGDQSFVGDFEKGGNFAVLGQYAFDSFEKDFSEIYINGHPFQAAATIALKGEWHQEKSIFLPISAYQILGDLNDLRISKFLFRSQEKDSVERLAELVDFLQLNAGSAPQRPNFRVRQPSSTLAGEESSFGFSLQLAPVSWVLLISFMIWGIQQAKKLKIVHSKFYFRRLGSYAWFESEIQNFLTVRVGLLGIFLLILILGPSYLLIRSLLGLHALDPGAPSSSEVIVLMSVALFHFFVVMIFRKIPLSPRAEKGFF